MNRAVVEIPEQFLIFLNMYNVNLDEKSAMEVYQELLHLCYNNYYLGDQVEQDGKSITIVENIICILDYNMNNVYDSMSERTESDLNSFYTDVFNAIDMFIYSITPILHPLGFFNSNITHIRLGCKIFNNMMVICY